jgi:hypothetical protein
MIKNKKTKYKVYVICQTVVSAMESSESGYGQEGCWAEVCYLLYVVQERPL